MGNRPEAQARDRPMPSRSFPVAHYISTRERARGLLVPAWAGRLGLMGVWCGFSFGGSAGGGIRPMPLGVTGNTSASGAEESWFDPRRGNWKPDMRLRAVGLFAWLPLIYPDRSAHTSSRSESCLAGIADVQ